MRAIVGIRGPVSNPFLGPVGPPPFVPILEPPSGGPVAANRESNAVSIAASIRRVTVVLNGKTVLPGATIPDLPERGRLALQHHGGERDGTWNSPPSLLQFKNIFIKELGR